MDKDNMEIDLTTLKYVQKVIEEEASDVVWLTDTMTLWDRIQSDVTSLENKHVFDYVLEEGDKDVVER